METKTGKRIVSKGEYVQAHGQRASIGLLVVCLWGMAFICGLTALAYGGGLVAFFMGWHKCSGMMAAMYLAMVVVFGAGTSIFWKWADKALLASYAIHPGIPLTRANTADLPIRQTLVRASSEPEQAQEAVLLRAAEGQGTPPEQLMRAVGGLD